MSNTDYADSYRDIDFRKHPEKYKIGRGEQGVLIAQPYKDEILPHWKFATPAAARISSDSIYKLFIAYRDSNDFVGMDMARKFLQMGFTRARRYANHPTGKKYDDSGEVSSQAADWKMSDKAQSAEIFYKKYIEAKDDPIYLKLKQKHKGSQK